MKTPIEVVAGLSSTALVDAVKEVSVWRATGALPDGVVRICAKELQKHYGKDYTNYFEVIEKLVLERAANLWVREHVYKTFVVRLIEAWPEFLIDEDVDGAELVDWVGGLYTEIRRYMIETDPKAAEWLEEIEREALSEKNIQ